MLQTVRWKKISYQLMFLFDAKEEAKNCPLVILMADLMKHQLCSRNRNYYSAQYSTENSSASDYLESDASSNSDNDRDDENVEDEDDVNHQNEVKPKTMSDLSPLQNAEEKESDRNIEKTVNMVFD